jgi:hypothetical protein
MKIRRISNYASVAAVAAFLPLAIATSRAASSPSQLNADDVVLQQAQLQRVDWDDAKRHKLRRAYWLIENTKDDYSGHKEKAKEEIKKAGENMGLDLHGEHFGDESQRRSDERLREARQLLMDIVDPGHHKEHEHIWKAVQEIDKALRRA